MKLRVLTYLLISAAALSAPADTFTRIIAPGFATLKVQNIDDFFAPPVLRLGDTRVRLVVSFDELADDRRYMRYSITHLTEKWTPSSLVPSEYASGFDEAPIEDFAFSQNTFRHYVNYRIEIPSDELYPLISGNYLLRVYDEDSPDETLLQARFAVSEDVGTLTGEYSNVTDRGTDGPWQQLSFAYNPGEMKIADPFADLQAYVVQNSDPTSAILVKPLRLQGGTLIYEHRPELIFPAGNEFRRFEITRTDYTGMHVKENRYEGDGYSAILQEDEPRVDKPYLYDQTQQGRFKIDEYNSTDPDLGADYLLTTFTLNQPRVMNGDVYLQGEFTGYLPEPRWKMQWNEQEHNYTLTTLLKQGSYNYRYALKGKDASDLPTCSPVEGDFPDTRNEYTIYIYYNPPGARYARLLKSAVIRP